jgi:hypothetical protein
VTDSDLEAHDVITIYNGRAEIENPIKEGKKTLSDGTKRVAIASQPIRQGF